MVGFVEVMVKLPFYSLLFALSMIFLSIWCLFCCCCPCCPQWFQNLPNTIFELIEPPPDRKFIEYLHNYFNTHTACPVTLPISEVVSQTVTNKSYVVCVKSEKYAFLLTLRPLGSMRPGEAELHTLQYWAR